MIVGLIVGVLLGSLATVSFMIWAAKRLMAGTLGQVKP